LLFFSALAEILPLRLFDAGAAAAAGDLRRIGLDHPTISYRHILATAAVGGSASAIEAEKQTLRSRRLHLSEGA
jgi:hypothetical protein